MKSVYLIPILVVVVTVGGMAQAQAQGRIYRCGNAYTNDAAEAKTKSCKLVEGGFITVVEGTRVQGGSGNGGGPVKFAAASPSSAGVRVDSVDQKSRDADARQVLESELKKAESRQGELAKEYNNGEPDKQGAEGRNYQKYLDRVGELKANIARNENDIAGIKRELGRVPASK